MYYCEYPPDRRPGSPWQLEASSFERRIRHPAGRRTRTPWKKPAVTHDNAYHNVIPVKVLYLIHTYIHIYMLKMR